MSQTKQIGIVGGGLLGMTLALQLAERGIKVTLLEAAERLGGLTSPARIGKYTWDQFYHVMLLSDTDLLDLLDRLDLKEQISWNKTKTGFYTEGHLYSMSNIMEFLSFPPVHLLDTLRLAFNIFYASRIKSWPRLENVLVTDWLIRFSGKRTFDKIWLPLLKSKLGENYRRTNAAFIWGTIARMYAARRSRLKQEMFGYVNGGYSTILEKFEQVLGKSGVETLCNTSPQRIVDKNACVGIQLSTGEALTFDDVVLTIPCNQIPMLCPQLSDHEKQRLNGVTYQGVISSMVLLKKPLASYYITNITDEWVPFTGVIEMTAVVNRDYFDGNSLVYLPRYLPQEDTFWDKSDGEIQAQFTKALQSMYASFSQDDVLAWKITRARYVHPITTINYSKELLPATQTSLKHVFIINSAQIPNGTMNVNEIVGLANRKAKEIEDLLS